MRVNIAIGSCFWILLCQAWAQDEERRNLRRTPGRTDTMSRTSVQDYRCMGEVSNMFKDNCLSSKQCINDSNNGPDPSKCDNGIKCIPIDCNRYRTAGNDSDRPNLGKKELIQSQSPPRGIGEPKVALPPHGWKCVSSTQYTSLDQCMASAPCPNKDNSGPDESACANGMKCMNVNCNKFKTLAEDETPTATSDYFTLNDILAAKLPPIYFKPWICAAAFHDTSQCHTLAECHDKDNILLPDAEDCTSPGHTCKLVHECAEEHLTFQNVIPVVPGAFHQSQIEDGHDVSLINPHRCVGEGPFPDNVCAESPYCNQDMAPDAFENKRGCPDGTQCKLIESCPYAAFHIPQDFKKYSKFIQATHIQYKFDPQGTLFKNP